MEAIGSRHEREFVVVVQWISEKLVHRYDQERAQPTQPKNKWDEDNGVKLYTSFEWASRGDLLLNTVQVDYHRQVARFSWGQTLALKMGWIKEVSTGQF